MACQRMLKALLDDHQIISLALQARVKFHAAAADAEATQGWDLLNPEIAISLIQLKSDHGEDDGDRASDRAAAIRRLIAMIS